MSNEDMMLFIATAYADWNTASRNHPAVRDMNRASGGANLRWDGAARAWTGSREQVAVLVAQIEAHRAAAAAYLAKPTSGTKNRGEVEAQVACFDRVLAEARRALTT